MAKIIIAGQAVVVKSEVSLDELKEIKKYRPDALTLYKGEGSEKEPDFMIGFSAGAGTVGKYGVEFGSASHDDDKLATVTMVIPEEVEDVKKYVSDAIGAAVLKLNRLEASLPEVVSEIEKEREEIDGIITIAG